MGGKIKKGKEKLRKLHKKNVENGLKNASVWVINSKKVGFAPPAANFFVGGENESQQRGGGNIAMHNIYILVDVNDDLL